jgi:hypothetical protein
MQGLSPGSFASRISPQAGSLRVASRIGPFVRRGAHWTSGSCKHQSGHDGGVDTKTDAARVAEAGPGQALITIRELCEARRPARSASTFGWSLSQ